MIFTTLIQPQELQALLSNSTCERTSNQASHQTLNQDSNQASDKKSDVLVFDVSCAIQNLNFGKERYAAGHIPGAVFLDFDRFVTGEVTRGTGRHPMPDKTVFRDAMASFGMTPDKQIVLYDQGGVGFAARLWYQLRWLGLEKVAVLNGGFKGWSSLNLPITAQVDLPQSVDVDLLPIGSELELPVPMALLQDNLETQDYLVADARPESRFHGIGETIDHKAGHIPLSVSRCGSECFDENGFFKSAEQLKTEFLSLLGDKRPDQLIHSCGSGVNASVNLLAMAYCGLSGSKLYPGSFSQWIDFEENPIDTE